jgi:hypothetical protein
MVVRHDLDVEAIGQMAALPPDLSPLQIGTQGDFDGVAFTLLGRVRVSYEEGSWNEWYAVFSDGRSGWVAEAQGFFMASFEIPVPDDFPGEPELTPGRNVTVASQDYAVVDRKQTTCLGSEGELPLVAVKGRVGTSVDLMNASGGFAGVEYSDSGTRLYIGRYAAFDELKLSNLRPVPGWSEGCPEVRREGTTALNCPKCGATITLRAAGLSMSAKCESCGELLDTSAPDLRLIQTAHERKRLNLLIPIGQRGVLFGVNYEVIGFQHVTDEYSGWTEYLLFNPWQGFAWLVTYCNHWTFVRRLLRTPELDPGGVVAPARRARLDGEDYRLFATSKVATDYVLGEFYWQIRIGMPVSVTDFVHPPRILSCESYEGLKEETWSQGEYVEPELIQQAFNLQSPLAERFNTYLNQPNPYADKGRQLKWLVPLCIGLLLVIQLVSSRRAARQQVFGGSFTYRASATNPVAVTPPFELKGGPQAVDFTLEAPVDNNWLEIGVDLVNTETLQATAAFEEEIGYYHGYDDGPWSEGSQVRHHLLPAVPAGKYALAIEASADSPVSEMPFRIAVVGDVLIWSNFWIGLGLLLLYPVYCWTRALLFERARWAESDYSPFTSGGSSDDD